MGEVALCLRLLVGYRTAAFIPFFVWFYLTTLKFKNFRNLKNIR